MARRSLRGASDNRLEIQLRRDVDCLGDSPMQPMYYIGLDVNPLSKVQKCESSPLAQPMCLVSRASYTGRTGLHGVMSLAAPESHLYCVYCPRTGGLERIVTVDLEVCGRSDSFHLAYSDLAAMRMALSASGSASLALHGISVSQSC